MKKRMTLTTALLVLGMFVSGWLTTASAQTPPNINWSMLSEANPLSSLSITTGYKAAIHKDTGIWKSLSDRTAAYWMAPYTDDRFQLSITTFTLKTNSFTTYLVSPALDLSKVKGMKLSFDFTNQLCKGNTTPLRVVIIDKTGTILQEILSAAGSTDYTKDTWQAKEGTLKSDLSGVGFLAFVAGGDKTNYATYQIRNISLEETGAVAPSISASPKEIDFYDNAIGSTSYTKEVNIIAKNITGNIEVSKTGDPADEFAYDINALTSNGGKVTVTFTAKAAGKKTAKLQFKSGEVIEEVTLKGEGTGTGGGTEVTISVAPSQLTFPATKVGTSNAAQSCTLKIANSTAIPQYALSGDAKADFEVTAPTALTATGGTLQIVFKPTAVGARQATLTITAGTQSATIALRGEGTQEGGGSVTPSQPTEQEFEVLKDNFFYEFTGNKPTHWQTNGTISKLEGSERYNSSSQFGVGITTAKNEIGFIKQVIDLNKAGEAGNKVVREGNELEGLIHYQTVESTLQSGPFRLACKWIDAQGNEIQTQEKGLLNNAELFFGRAKAYGTFKFRTVCPKGAVKFEFALEVAPESKVFVDDFSLTCLDNKGIMKPFVTMLPQYRTIYGKVGETEEYPIAVQTKHLGASIEPVLNGTDVEKVFKFKDFTKVEKDQTIATKLQVTPTKKGAYYMDKSGAYNIAFKGGSDSDQGMLIFTAFFIDPKEPPTIKLKTPETVAEMVAEPGKTQEQTLEFNITGAITDVKLAIDQKANGAFRIDKALFWYAPSGKLYNGPVKVTFAPKTEGEYTATLTISSPMADDLVLNLKGVCKKSNGDLIAERFSADNAKDPRFKGEVWKNYHKFDQGYWYLDGTWNKAQEIMLKAQGKLYYDEVLANGVNTVAVKPATTQLTLEYSIDGGGHWTKANQAQNGTFTLGIKRPVLVRFINGATETKLEEVAFLPYKESERESFDKIENAMIKNADNEALPLLNETFTGYRHTRILSIPGWQNLMLKAERPFYAWEQKDKAQTMVENEVAQISFLAYGREDDRPHTTWLLSPTLSYKKAKSKVLTFRMQFRNPIENGKEQFGLYLIEEKADNAKSHYIDLTKHVPLGVNVEPDTWFDYYIDLSKIEGISLDDLFHVGFSFDSPVGGNKTSLNIMIDDVTFGRDNLPSIALDQDMLTFEFYPGQKATPQAFNVTTKNATHPVTLTLVPSRLKSTFIMKEFQLPKEGGAVAVGFKSDSKKDVAGMLLVQTRGAESKVVRLLGKNLTAIEELVADGDLIVYPTTATESLYVQGEYQSYSLFSLDGVLVAQGQASDRIDVSTLPAGRYVVRLYRANSGYKPFVIEKH